MLQYAPKKFRNSANTNYYLGETFEGNKETEKAIVYYEAAYKLEENKELLEKITKLKEPE